MTVFIVLSGFPLPSNASQAAAQPWMGVEEVRSHQFINMRPGTAITFTIKFKNTGTSTWYNITDHFVAIATVEPVKRKSAFKHDFWNEEDYRPARLSERTVKPGELGTFRFALQAPDEEGDYEEKFMAVAKSVSWIDGTEFTIPITVVNELPKLEVINEDINPSITPNNEKSTQSDSSAPVVMTLAEDYPVRDDSYSAQWLGGQVKSFDVKPGEQILHTFDVKNNGTQTWKNSGSHFVSLYTVRPNYHDSQFYSGGPGWLDQTQIRLSSDTVKPGDTGKVVMMLQVPKSGGVYTENIRLAVENYSWIKGGEIKLVLNVEKEESASNESSSNDSPSESIYRHTEYEAQYMVSSHNGINLSPGQQLTFQVGFKNVGDVKWGSSGNRYVSLYTIDPNYRASRFASVAADGWMSTNQVEMQQDQVLPGQLAFFKFTLQAPTTPGAYNEKFRLAVEDYTWVKGGEFTLPITVERPNTNNSNVPDTSVTNLGPIMRVGIFDSADAFSVTADSPFEVVTGSGQILGSLPARTEVVIDYIESTGMYTVTSASINQTLNDYITVKAQDDNTIMEILSFERRLPWNPVVNENLFRGSIEIRHSSATDKTWAINILPMEYYLRGIAETSSSSPVEFLKVMSIAARTYGFYHYERQTKHADEHFYVDSVYDQVYKGYALEKRHPSLVEAVTLTAGEVVTYTDPTTNISKIAITPYFSRSDGRTRAWSEVWGGEVPWTQSVPVPHDIGQTLWGHGVGMSARGGLLMVVEDGKTYDQVLHYFFKDIIIADRY